MNFPNIWLAISFTLADIYDDKAHSATFLSPDNQINALLTLLGIVDGMTNQVNEFFNNEVTAQELAFKMDQDSTLWSTLLWLSGGLLELSKCLYHFIHFGFQPDSIPGMIPDNLGLALTITSTNRNPTVAIEHKAIYDPHKILGHYKASAGTNKNQYLVLVQKAEKYAEK
eukprot:8859892-Ditylum_brightwellii.AAC.1